MSTRDFVIYGSKSRFGNVTVIRDNLGISVKLHNTIVARMERLLSKQVQLNTGGWDTVTTRSAMNHALAQFCPDKHWRVGTIDGELFVYLNGRKVLPFVDGMVFRPDDPQYQEIADKGGIL